MSGKQCQEAFQYRMIMVVLIIYAKGYLWPRVSCIGDIRIETIADLSFYKSKGTFNAFCDEPLFRRKVHKYIVLDSKNGVRKLTGRTGNKISSELFSCKGFISGQRMFWRADTGHRGAGKLSVPQRRSILSIFYAQSCHELGICPELPSAGYFLPFPE